MGLDFVEILLHPALPSVIFLASVGIACSRAFAGGIILIIEGLLVAATCSVASHHCPRLTTVLVLLTGSVPLLVSGILFILSRRERLALESPKDRVV